MPRRRLYYILIRRRSLYLGTQFWCWFVAHRRRLLPQTPIVPPTPIPQLPHKPCPTQDAGVIRSRRVSSSPSWSSVRAYLFFVVQLSSQQNLAGASGTGRTTFVNTLCESEVLTHKIADNADTAHVEEGIRIKPVNVGKHLLLFKRVFFFSCPRFCDRQNSRRMAYALR